MQQTGELEEISVRDLTGLRIGNAQDDQAKTGAGYWHFAAEFSLGTSHLL